MLTVAEAPSPLSPYDQIRANLRELYLSDPRPWIIGFSGGKDSTPDEHYEIHRNVGLPDDLLKIQKAEMQQLELTVA